MDTLQMAQSIMGYYEDVDLSEKEGERALLKCQAYAAIATAEQLKRIADMMEGYLSVYSDTAVMQIAKGE